MVVGFADAGSMFEGDIFAEFCRPDLVLSARADMVFLLLDSTSNY